MNVLLREAQMLQLSIEIFSCLSVLAASLALSGVICSAMRAESGAGATSVYRHFNASTAERELGQNRTPSTTNKVSSSKDLAKKGAFCQKPLRNAWNLYCDTQISPPISC
jgi:hypothetical protein